MNYKEKQIKKLFYPIGEVAQMFNVSVSCIRYWEKEFDILKPKKNKKGNRMFTKKDVDNLRIIYHLTKERGFTLEGVKKKLRENKADTIDNIKIINHLKNIRKFLVEFREEL
ncbi:MAG: MerR family transcriptional regulator [Flavobacteriales bacterium TMED123]|nr:MAG: MerR family transcriptional regulator [Flavobacteriales bacterium TMED123]|tara:strand:+ start:3116 stop:3451 length:336 start_codon:yes stop_codon:yes gene_type:complete